MASVPIPSTSYNLSTSSDSENEIRSNINLDNIKIDFDKTFNTTILSSLPRQTTNNSLKYFKKLKRKKPIYESDSTSTSYTLSPSKNKYNLTESKNVSNYKKKKRVFKNKNTAYVNSIDVNREFANAFESSSDSDFPDTNFLSIISKNKEIITSPVSKESEKNKFYSIFTSKKTPTDINIANITNKLESSISLDSLDFSQGKTDSVNFQQKDVYNNNELNLDQSLSDFSVSDLLFVRQDKSNLNSQINPTPDTDSSIIRMKSPFISLEINNELQPQEPSNAILNLSDLTNDEAIEVEQNRTVDDIEIVEPELNNEHSNSNEAKSISVQTSNSFISIEKSVDSEPVCNDCNRSSKLKDKNNGYTETNKTKRNKSKRQKENILTSISDILRVKKSRDKITKENVVKTNETVEDIGLEYDTGKDNYMVELPNGSLVPVFLSTLKPKYVKKLCACGITLSDIPLYWSESFHDILHQNIYKLHVKGDLYDNDSVNIKQNNLLYRILILCEKHYNDENIRKTIKDVNDFVCLEYGISKTSIQSHNYSTYLAVLPNFKVIGYLEVEPIQNAYTVTNDEQYSKNTVSVKFGISKIWSFIKYRHKNVEINLLEHFCKKKNLQKEDLAFSLNGCQGIQFIQEYTGNKNILIYNAI